MENEKEEAVKPNVSEETTVEKTDEVTEDVSDSPSDEGKKEEHADDFEKEVDGMSVEQLKEFARKEREAKKRAIANVRNQQQKHREKLLDASEGENDEDTQESPDEEGKEDSVEAIVERKVKEALEHNLNTNTPREYTKGAQSWLYDQSWGKAFAPETEGSTELYAELAGEIKRRLDILQEKGKPVSTVDEYRMVVRKAAAEILSSPEPLLKEKEDTRMDEYQKQQASSMTGTAGKNTREKPLTRQQIDMAMQCGHDPKEVYRTK